MTTKRGLVVLSAGAEGHWLSTQAMEIKLLNLHGYSGTTHHLTRRMMKIKEKHDGTPRTLNRLVGFLLCRVGWHNWTWKFESGDTLYLDAPPPDHAKCSRCGARYGRSAKQKLKG